ncbi:dTDP-4-dehydrorhamnose 3,5-epimerase [Rheinheimera sp. D18]|uniref:dTDP-4-dehydrorhamnose 3,5-epimerase n=1 Tax=Rheinheimera sp. D18 TaxID=2545632 RepID=UPI0010534550|nr:dTDP-4-dehydrorhamnose 3,5-epimerase [Rheinheimera sp. D18]QBL09803.1 dTDP-4-dehydrorhamnose 3,5-epimerase [Rheinheimera sp. D18]
MRVTHTSLVDVLLMTPSIYNDARGHFFESFNQQEFHQQVSGVDFVQDNQSRSVKNVLRGLHYQIIQPQGKLVSVLHGEIYDVVVDLRRSSAQFGQWTANILSAENRQQIWVPPGFAHGFLVMSEYADVFYKTTDFYSPAGERSICWNDLQLAINWPNTTQIILSEKDQRALPFSAAEYYD